MIKMGRRRRWLLFSLKCSIKLEVALFGQFVDEVNGFIANSDVVRPTVAIQFAQVKTFNGKIVLQNVMFGIRLLFEPHIPEALELKNRLLAITNEQSQSLSTLSDGPFYSFDHDFLFATPRKLIEDLQDCREYGAYVVYGIIVAIINSSDWWYASCKCNKVVRPDSEMHYCECCNCHVVNVTPRYRIKISVTNEFDTATFVVSDRDGEMLLGKSCSDFLGGSTQIVGFYVVYATIKTVNQGPD